ncbi:hypothetical protein [uncultured Lacinutrix sp.]|uniref:hypothetical protein n=1 Tax=uncultured Lacinutrix sp. TaxID=574032 RepID=UPI00263A2CBD|nr:hypothetical protein [uncultured Lacinutrix sp.]
MKKKNLKNLVLSKNTVSRFSKHKVNGGGTMSTTPDCATGNNPSAIIVCMEDFTLGCSPSFMGQCPDGDHSLPGWC